MGEALPGVEKGQAGEDAVAVFTQRIRLMIQNCRNSVASANRFQAKTGLFNKISASKTQHYT